MTIGDRVRDLEWEARTSGAAAYAGDVRLPGMLVGRILRAPHAHARIRSIDTSAAQRSLGVRAVVTARDLGEVRYVHHGGPLADRQPLASAVVRFVGEEVAAVAAETAEQAEAALRLIEVDYQPLPVVADMESALRPDAPLVHPDGNVALRIERQYGAADDTLSAADVTVAGRYRFGRQTHACMETNTTVARWDAEAQRLDLWTSTQAPYFIRKEVAQALGLDIEQVRTHQVAVGGGFGSKSKISEHEVLCAALARQAGRPVRLVLDRSEEFATTKCRHDFDITLETGATRDGHLTRRTARMLVDNGAYNHSGPSVMGYGTLVMGSMYRTESVSLAADLVYTNKHPGGQFRGYGAPQALFAIESQMDELADALGVDPIELRIRNAHRTGDQTHAGWRLASARLVECLQAAREAMGWDEKRRLGGSGRGVGIAAAIHVTGAHVYPDAERSAAGVDLLPDGRVRVRFGGADAGTGQRTVLAQIAATELGVPLDRIEVVTMDTERTPPDLGAWSSRGTFMGGHAVRTAAGAVADRLRAAAAQKFGIDPRDVRLADGHAATNGQHVPLGELLPFVDDTVDGELRVDREFVADMEPVNPATGVANLSPTYAFAAHAVEVDVDRTTGEVRVLDVVAAHDAGVLINPVAAESQIVGGVVMGLGAALGEELIYEGGRLANPAYLNYALPRAADVPTIRPVVIQERDPVGPYGAKSIGEISLSPVPAAVANAVAHATGARIRELPLTPDKILTALREDEGRSPRRYHLWRRPDRWWIEGTRRAYPRGLFAALDRWGTRLARKQRAAEITRVDRPATVEEATSRLRAATRAAPIAGGTDLLPAQRQDLVDADTLVDLTAVERLRQISENERGDLFLGAGVVLADALRHPALSVDTGLRETIERIASPQIREMATVGGNLCQQKRCWFFRNGFNCYKRGGATAPCYAVLGDHRFYHAAMGAHRCQAVTPSDLATTLTALDAQVLLADGGASRSLPIGAFFTGPGETALQRSEILVEVGIPAGARRRVTRFEKLRLWEGDFAVVSAAVSVDLQGRGRVGACRVVLGAMAPTPYRARDVERVLSGSRLDQVAIERASAAWTRRAHPLPGNAWKVDAAVGLLRRCLQQCAATGASG